MDMWYITEYDAEPEKIGMWAVFAIRAEDTDMSRAYWANTIENYWDDPTRHWDSNEHIRGVYFDVPQSPILTPTSAPETTPDPNQR